MSRVRELGTQRKLRAGIVGGGVGSFIGTVHRIAAQLDNQAEVVAGAMSAPLRTNRLAKPEQLFGSQVLVVLHRKVHTGSFGNSSLLLTFYFTAMGVKSWA